MSASLECSLPPNARSVALYACHFDGYEFPPNEQKILDQLVGIFDLTIALISAHDGKEEITQISPNLMLCKLENKGLDFGKWAKLIKGDLLDDDSFHTVLLINDSCTLQENSNIASALFRGHTLKLGDFWGITDSYEHFHHIQSYFLYFEGQTAIRSLKEFFDELSMDVFSKSKLEIVNACEVGLSKHMLRRGHRINAIYCYDQLAIRYNLDKLSIPSFNSSYNPSYMLANVLEQEGCPLIKKTNILQIVKRNGVKSTSSTIGPSLKSLI